MAVPLGRRALPSGASLEQLSAKDRAMLVARYYLDLSAAEIAEIVGSDAEDVDAITVRVLAGLRGSIEVGED